jgi:predicted ATPase
MVERRGGRRLPTVTPTVRDVITARLDRLSAECVRFLRAAAIVGREFPLGLVATMVELPVAECLDVLDEAARAGLVEGGAITHEQWFVHALVRDAIEDGLGTPERLRLHRRAAEVIEKQHRTPQGSALFDLTRHWAAAAVDSDAARAARWSERAGSEAMRQRAYEEAVRLFRQAVHVDVQGDAVGGPAPGATCRCTAPTRRVRWTCRCRCDRPAG